jgi:HEAT repeat protein
MDDLEKLIQLVLDPEQNNLEALIKLNQSKDPRIIDLLILALSDGDSRVRVKAITHLRDKHDERAVQPLIECLKDSNPDVRWMATFALGYFNDERAVQPLIQTLNDPELSVRGAAITALGELKNPLALEALIAVLPASVEALLAIGDNRAVEPLIAQLRNERLKRDNYLRIRVRRKIIEALGDFGDARAVDVLIESLDDWVGEGLRTTEFEHTGGGVFPSVCHYAAKALEKIGTPEALDKVRQWRSTPYPEGGMRWT